LARFTAQDWSIFFGSIAALIGSMVVGIVKVLAAIQQVHLSVNSRMDELLQEARKGALAEGRDQMRLSKKDNNEY
jgi:hypothetical protein